MNTVQKMVEVTAEDCLGKNTVEWAECLMQDGAPGVFMINYDTDCPNPREEDDYCLSTIYARHNRYRLSDKAGEEWAKLFGDDVAEMKKELKSGAYLFWPLYLYEHSGITISLTPFSDPWDSGQVGFVFVAVEDILKEFGRKHMSKKLRETVNKIVQSEIDIYDAYLQGNCYWMQVKNLPTEDFDCCGGYLFPHTKEGDEYKKTCVIEFLEGRGVQNPEEVFASLESKW